MILLLQLKHAEEDMRRISLYLKALGALMLIQDTTIWETVYALQCVNAFLSYVDHPLLKIRKVVIDILSSLLQNHSKKNAKQLRSYIGAFCKEVLKSSTRSEYKRSVFILQLLETSMTFLLPADSVEIAELAMKLQNCDQPVLTAAAFRMLDSFFQHFSFSLSTEQSLHTLKTLALMGIDSPDMEANVFFYTSLGSLFIQCFKLHQEKTLLILPSIVEVTIFSLLGCFLLKT